MPPERRKSGRLSLPTTNSIYARPEPAFASTTAVGTSTPAQPGSSAELLRSILSPPKAPGGDSPHTGRKIQFSENVESRTFKKGEGVQTQKVGEKEPLPGLALSKTSSKRKSLGGEESEAQGASAARSSTRLKTAASPTQITSPGAKGGRKKPKTTGGAENPDPAPAAGKKSLKPTSTSQPTPPPSEFTSTSSAVSLSTGVDEAAVALPTPSASDQEDGQASTTELAPAAPSSLLAGDDDSDDLSSIASSSGEDKPRVKRAYNRKPLSSFVKRREEPEPVGPAKEKVYLIEGLFTNRSVDTRFPGYPGGLGGKGAVPYKPLALLAALNDDGDDTSEGGDVVAATSAKPVKAKPSKAWVTILPDGTQVEGRLPQIGSSEGVSVTPQPKAAQPKATSKRGARYAWVTDLPDGTTIDGQLAIPQEDLQVDAVKEEEDEVESAVSLRKSIRARGRSSLPAPSASTPSDLNFQPFRKSRSSLPGPSASPAPSGPLLPRRRGRPPKGGYPLVPPVPESNERFVFPLPTFDPGMLERERPFQLTYDIIWEWQQGGLDSKKQPPLFKTITRNLFPYRPRDLTIAHVCECKPPAADSDEFGCGDSCINRALEYLCSPKTCPCGERCGNKSLYKRETPNLKVFWTGSRGFGLKAMEPIAKGSFVLDYRGEVITLAEFYSRLATVYKGRHDYYALEYGEGEYLDSGMKGNVARFINHGCAPNLRVHKFTTLGEGVEEYEVGFWATRNIAKGEELFYDYNFDSFATRSAPTVIANATLAPAAQKPKKGAKGKKEVVEEPVDDDLAEGQGRQRCNCGADVCTGWIGGAKRAKKERALAA